MFHVENQMSRQEQTSELILDILGDIQSRLVTMQEKQEEMEKKQLDIDFKQDRLRELVKVMASKISPDILEEPSNPPTPSVSSTPVRPTGLPVPVRLPGPSILDGPPGPSTQGRPSGPSTQAHQFMRPISVPSSEQETAVDTTPSQPQSAKLMSGPDSGTYLLGGSETLVRSVADYNAMLREVQQRRRNASDNEKGKLLCVCLLKREVPKEELAIKNVTGNSRDENNKRCKIPQLDRVIINSIFHQAKMQFTGFSDWYTDSKSKTVEALNECCKRARYEKRKRVLVETVDNSN